MAGLSFNKSRQSEKCDRHNKKGFRVYIKQIESRLLVRHKQACLKFALEHQHWTADMLEIVI